MAAMAIPLEDNFTDIIGKAQRGLGISDSRLAEEARISSDRVRKLRRGELDEMAIYRIAPILGLAGRALFDLASGTWHAPEIELPQGAAQFNTRYDDMTVNAYLVWDPESRDAVAFDTGADCSEMIERVKRERLTVKLILLTHSHPDHVADLARLKKETGAPIYISDRESADGAEAFEEGRRFECGALRIDSFLTWGHSKGGMTFFVEGLEQPLAIVGDSLFAGSMGGGAVSYQEALRNNREKVLTLPEETIVCPGHGPLTTVEKEKRENPFFAGLNFEV